MEYIFRILTFELLFILLFNLSKIHAQFETYNDRYSKYNLEIYGDDKLIDEFTINYNFSINKFEENDILDLPYVKYVRICNEYDIKEKNKDDIEKMILWDTNELDEFYKSIPYLNVFPFWYINQKEKGKTFCFIIENVGWTKNAYDIICDKDKKHPCPNLILIGTTQLTYRHKKNDVVNLNKYIDDFYRKNGVSFGSLLNKYSYKDYRIDNKWLAIPVIVDIRALRFNTTTFDYCHDQGYNIQYPPV
ncbi:hypothetical protein PIROE2DRAFT_9790 [Piromyces sp. E2]|nr:hypothetical protein PIROE2DRAFT_9790 [Piromyces sp. E2]|eukprot:OUM63647.1 hypothetical protein PIROE2DRAFT_9790 [Piromyces sp. E2]